MQIRAGFEIAYDCPQPTPMLAALATVTIMVGNIGALGQSSLKRMLGYSGVAQAGYMLGGVVVGNRLGIDATVLYIIVYLGMNLAAFAVIAVVEREDVRGDDISALSGLGTRSPALAWAMTIAMLSLAGIPGTAGFIGKFQLIHALVHGDYLWLAIVLVVGSMISLGYYLRVVATVWMGSYTAAPAPAAAVAEGGMPPIAGGSQEGDAGGSQEGDEGGSQEGDEGGSQEGEQATGASAHGAQAARSSARAWLPAAFVALLFAAATIFFGIVPQPLFHLANHAGSALGGLFY